MLRSLQLGFFFWKSSRNSVNLARGSLVFFLRILDDLGKEKWQRKKAKKEKEKEEKKRKNNPFISNITSREIKWKRGRLTRLGCWGWDLGWVVWDEGNDVSQEPNGDNPHQGLLRELVKSCSGDPLLGEDLSVSFSPVFNVGNQKANELVGRQRAKSSFTERIKGIWQIRKRKRKKNSRKEQTYSMAGTVGDWVTGCDNDEDEGCPSFCCSICEKGKEEKEKGKRKMITKFKKKKKIRITQNDPKMTERMTRRYNIPWEERTGREFDEKKELAGSWRKERKEEIFK